MRVGTALLGPWQKSDRPRAPTPDTPVEMQELDANTVLGAIPGRPRYVSWRVLRRIPLIVLPTAAVLALGVVFIYLRDRENDLAKAQAEAASVVQVQARIVGHEVEAVRSIVGYLAREPILKAYLRGEVTRSELEGEWIRLLLAAGSFHQIRLLDPLGREQVRVNQGRGSPFAVPENELQEKSTRYYFEKAWPLESEQVYVSPLDLNVEHGVVETPWKPMLRFATPVYDADGAKRGILVLNYEGDRLIERMRRSTSYASGWTWLVDVDGYYLQGPRMADSWAFMFGLDPTFARDYPGAWERISAVPESLFAKPKGVFAAKRVRLPHSDEAFAAVGELDLHVVTFVPPDPRMIVRSLRGRVHLRRIIVGHEHYSHDWSRISRPDTRDQPAAWRAAWIDQRLASRISSRGMGA